MQTLILYDLISLVFKQNILKKELMSFLKTRKSFDRHLYVNDINLFLNISQLSYDLNDIYLIILTHDRHSCP